MSEFKSLGHGASLDTEAYRAAVTEILEDILREFRCRDGKPLTQALLADSIDISKASVGNALRGIYSMDPVHLARLGQVYGAGFLNPYFRLMGAQAAPLEKDKGADILPMLTGVAFKISAARDPNGMGGATEVPQERRGYLHDLKRLVNRAGCLVQEIEVAA